MVGARLVRRVIAGLRGVLSAGASWSCRQHRRAPFAEKRGWQVHVSFATPGAWLRARPSAGASRSRGRHRRVWTVARLALSARPAEPPQGLHPAGRATPRSRRRAREALSDALSEYALPLRAPDAPPSVTEPPELTDDRYQRALYLHAAALAGLLGEEPAPPTCSTTC